jgi:hypothetical protein
MRASLLALLLCPAAAGAETLADTHFLMNFCWERVYDAAHLAAHPEQTVTAFRIGREPPGVPSAPGQLLMELRVTFRAEDGRRDGPEAEAIAYCRPAEDRLDCSLEGDAGVFGIAAQGRDILVTVGERGMGFETDEFHLLRPDEGDDRSFLLRRCG